MPKPLTIDRIVAHIVECKLDFTYSSGTLSSARAIIWEIHAQGLIGLGECAIASEKSCPGFGSGSTASDPTALKRALEPRVAPLLGADARSLEALLEPLPPQVDWDLLVIREGLSIALYDLVGKASSLPVHTLLGGLRRRLLPGMPVIHVGPSEVMSRRAAKWASAGYRHLKVKFRGDLQQDIHAIQSIRSAIGPDIPLVVDANAGYRHLADAVTAIKALIPLGVDYFEDMLDADNQQIAQLRKLTGARIMIDRQAWWPHIHDIIAAGAADIINHHPNNQGGLAAALQIDSVATAAGLQTAVGSSGVFGIQNAAFMQLATVIATSRPCEDIGLLPYFSGPTAREYAFDRKPSVIQNPYPIHHGHIHVPDAPGLGLTLDPQALANASIAQVQF
jgi:L-Ala-D/L-Glu epimerase